MITDWWYALLLAVWFLGLVYAGWRMWTQAQADRDAELREIWDERYWPEIRKK